MKKIIISTILIVLLFSLAGCGYGEYKGNVIEKQYMPARTMTQMRYINKKCIHIQYIMMKNGK